MTAVAVVGTASTFAILARFGQELAAGLAHAGADGEFLPTDTPAEVDRMIGRLHARRWDAIVAFNGGALPGCVVAGEPILTRVSAPFWSLMLDPYWHHEPRFAQPVPSRTWTWVDPGHAAQAAAAFPDSGPHRVLPHAGYLADPATAAPSRDLTVLMLGSWCDPRAVLAAIGGQRGAAQEAFARACLERWRADGGDPHDLIADEHLRQRGSPPVAGTLLEVETLIRSWVRIAVADGLAARGIRALVVGKGVFECPSLAAHERRGPVPFAEALALMARAQVVVEAGPLFANGTHERVLSACANGAAVVLSRTPFWDATLIGPRGRRLRPAQTGSSRWPSPRTAPRPPPA